DGWVAGFSGGYAQSESTTDDRASGSSTRFDLGATLKHEAGPWLIAGALGVGHSSFDTTRFIGIPTPGLTATASPEIWHGDLRLRAAHTSRFGAAYLRPYGELDLFFAHMPAFSETGAGGL